MPKTKSRKPKQSTPCPVCHALRAPHLRQAHLKSTHPDLDGHHDAIISAWRDGTEWTHPMAKGDRKVIVTGPTNISVTNSSGSDPFSTNGHRNLPALLASAGEAWQEAEGIAEQRKAEYAALLKEQMDALA